MVLARHGAVEALSIQGLDGGQVRVLERSVRDAGGAVLANAAGTSALVLSPLVTAGELPGRLASWSEHAGALGQAIADVLVARSVTPPPVVARGHRLDFGARTLVMGILNVTPDSFSGDGIGNDVDAALALAQAMAAAGADIIDVGGESTRPGSTSVTAGEEAARVIPIIHALATRMRVPISVDTRKATVAAAAIEAGASIVNDIWGFLGDPDMAGVVASHPQAAAVLMHNRREPVYEDLLEEVSASLRRSVSVAVREGVDAEQLIVDPGFGFAKTPAHNIELVRRLGELRGLGRAILIGVSRKSTIGALTGGAPPDQRLEGSLALATLAVANGATIVRTHDVAATVRALRVVDAVVRGTPQEVRAAPMPGPTG